MSISKTSYSGFTGGAVSSKPSSVLNASLKGDKTYTGPTKEDVVSISDEARELLDELKAKENRDFVTNETEMAFTKVASALPNSEAFHDMLSWLGTWSGSDGSKSFTLRVNDKDVEIDRDAYVKDPQKYAEMWKGLYENYTDVMKKLNLDPEIRSQRESLHDAEVTRKIRACFIENIGDELKDMLQMFNVSQS